MAYGRAEGSDNSNLGDASTTCPECGQEFQLFTASDDRQYVRHLERHL